MRKTFKKALAAGLAAAMALSMTACSKGNTENPTTTASDNNQTTQAPAPSSSGPRHLTIGSWWVQYYDSTHTALEDDPSYAGDLPAELKFANVKTIENKYNVTFAWENLTYAGTRESINTSILAGSPECDIYLVDLGMAVPAAMNGLATDLRTVLPADDDLFTTQNNIKFIDLGDGKACILKRVEAQATVEATYPLAFNKQLLEDYNLEDPRELYARGEWTWDKFIEYCQTLTKDTDGDGAVDQYGFGGYGPETFEQLMLSNGGAIAAGTTETLSSAQVGEALQMMQDMYITYNVCYPYENDDNVMRFLYRNGNIGFWPGAAWIAASNADYDYNGEAGTTLEFDTCYVQWPVGPSGNQETNKGKITSGEFYIIPAGVEDPQLVYNVLYDMWNWYAGDTTIRDDAETLYWWYAVTDKDPEIQDQNFDVMFDCGSREQFDLWNSIGIEYDLVSLIEGTVTPAQFQETYKQQIQDALDAYFN